jgi:hypothetical protein
VADSIETTPYVEHKVQSGETLASIAEDNGLTWQNLSYFNFGTDVPREVNRYLREIVGCTKRTRDGKNYMFTDDDDPGIIYVPTDPETFELDTGAQHQIKVKRPSLRTHLEVQTVDELGHRVENVDLTLQSMSDLPDVPDVSLHTNKSGYGKVDKIRTGRYRVLLASGEPAYMFDNSEPDPNGPPYSDQPSLVEAIIDTSNAERAITSIVVAQASEEELEQRGLLKQLHQRTGAKETLEGRGEETSGTTLRSANYCADNLAIAAGWANDHEIDAKKLVATTLHGFLRDYHPTALARGYHVLILTSETRSLVLTSSSGTVEKRFDLADGVTTRGLIGAYAMFEDVDGTTFVDMATMTSVVSVPGMGDDAELDKIVADPQGLIDALDKHTGEVQILYYAPTAGQLAALALLGGTGRLEDYGSDADVNHSIHQRNLAVCHNIKVAYDAYVRGYVDKVKATKNEDELRKLGPPRTPYEMPTPAGATDDQASELFHALNTNEFDAWVAIAHQLDHFAHRLSQGYPFLRIKPKFVATPKAVNKLKNLLRIKLPDINEKIPVEVEFEMNIDIQLVDGKFEVLTKGDALIKGKLKLDDTIKKVTKSGVPVEIAYKRSLGNPEKQVVSIKISKFQIELDTLGKSKLSLETAPGVWADAEMNPSTGMFGGGVTLKGKDLAKVMRGKSDFLDRWADRIDGFEVQLQIGLVGTREETILAVVSNAPGFFERRSLKELFEPKTQWVDLTLDEQHSLVALGWYAAVWDGKYHAQYKDQLPESVHQSPDELSDEEKVAIVHLGFYGYEDYRKMFKKAVLEFSDYSY